MAIPKVKEINPYKSSKSLPNVDIRKPNNKQMK